jgi:penicillin-binding protein 2
MFEQYFNKRRISRGIEIEDSIMTVTQEEEAVIETPFKRHGLNVLWIIIVLFLGIFVARIFYLDVIKGNYYADVSKGNRIRSTIIKAPRGKIMDRYGQNLASNIPSMDAIIIPADLPEQENEKQVIISKIANILGVDEQEVRNIFEVKNKNSLDPILLKENITRDQSLILIGKSRELPGVSVENTAIRSYEDGAIFSSVIGYDGKITKDEMAKNPEYIMTDYIGKAAIEKQYEKDLRGIAGSKQTEVDSLGNIKKNLGIINPQSGDNLILNIDADLQKKLYDSMIDILEKTNTKTAAAVIIDPRNGGILSMVNFPNYDNNLFARGITNAEYQVIINDKNLPLLNRALNGEYPPGSTIKPIIAAAALSNGIITPETIIDGMGGRLNIGGFSFGDWKVHGPSDVRTAIAESNDIFFYSIGGGYGNISGLGINQMKKYYNLFGLGESSGIDLPGESSGLIPDENWKLEKFKERWYIGNSYHASIGQGYVAATPLQLANYTATIANGGTLYVPRIVNQIQKYDGSIRYKNPEIIRKDFLSQNVLRVVQEGMRKTVTDGTAQQLKTLSVEVAGKTGTAEFGGEGKTHGWFISFAPYDSPVIAMVVLAEGGGEGDGHAAGVPITREVYDYYFNRNK